MLKRAIMSFNSVSNSSKKTIAEFFTTMNYSSGIESDKLALEWLDKNDRYFCGFVNGSWINDGKSLGEPITVDLPNLYHISDPITGNALAKVSLATADVLDDAGQNSHAEFEKWSSLNGETRSKHLFNIAQNITKYQQLFALVECLSSSKHLYKTRTKDVPNLIQSFYYYAGWALRDDYKDWKPTGVVCVIAEEYNNPLMSISWRVASILAGGNAVLLLVDAQSCLSAFLLAEICSLSGLPAGVLNVLPVNKDIICCLPSASKYIYTGPFERSKLFVEKTAMMLVPCEVLIPQRPTVIVYESADLHSAANGVIEALCFNDTRTVSGGCKVLIQESIFKKFSKLLEERFLKLQVGTTLSKTDISSIITKEQEGKLKLLTNKAKAESVKVVYGPEIKDLTYSCFSPKLLSNVHTTFELAQTEVGGPVVMTIPFRTVKESIAMFNLDKKGSAVSVWTEKLSLATEVAHKLKTGVVWLNTQNLLDASSAYSGTYLSGSSVEGSKEAFLSHLSVAEKELKPVEPGESDDIDSYGTHVSDNFGLKQEHELAQQNIRMKEYKFYIGGTQQKSPSGSVQLTWDHSNKPHACVAEGSAADVHSAISIAVTAQLKWGETESFKRSEILLNIAQILSKRKEEFAFELNIVTGNTLNESTDEIEKTIEILYYWALQTNKYGGELQELLKHGKVLHDRFPVGVIAIQCLDEKPLLSFLSLVTPAISFGNAVIAIPSEKYPTLALKMCEIFSLSNVPSGVINIISGSRDYLTRHLCLHMDVDAIWFCASGKAFIYKSCSQRPKKVFYCNGMWNNFNAAKSLKFVIESTFCKSICMPMGEIFAN